MLVCKIKFIKFESLMKNNVCIEPFLVGSMILWLVNGS